MKKNHLSLALKVLSKEEFRSFGNFVRSIYFNNRSEVVRFYDAFKSQYPEFNFDYNFKIEIFNKVYPGKKYSDNLMRKLLSLTLNLLMEFLTITHIREDKLYIGVKLLDILREKKLNQLFKKKHEVINKLLNDSKKNLTYYDTRLKYTSIKNGFYLNTNEKSMLLKFQDELDDSLNYFLSVIILQYIRLTEWSKNYNIKFNMKLYDEVVNYCLKNKSEEVNLADLYFNMLMLLNTEDEKYLRELNMCRKKFEKFLSPGDEFNIYIVSIQYCFKKIMKGHTEYRRKQFNLTKEMIERNLIPSGFIDPYLFTNSVRCASKLKEYKWTESFIDEFQGRLNPDLSDEIIKFTRAVLDFSKGNFEASLQKLASINIQRSNMKLELKNLQIMIYYELGYRIELELLIDSYKHFLKRDKTITNFNREANLLFVNLLPDIVKLNFPISSKKESLHITLNKRTNKLAMKSVDLNMIKKRIEKLPSFNHREWLYSKIEM